MYHSQQEIGIKGGGGFQGVLPQNMPSQQQAGRMERLLFMFSLFTIYCSIAQLAWQIHPLDPALLCAAVSKCDAGGGGDAECHCWLLFSPWLNA